MHLNNADYLFNYPKVVIIRAFEVMVLGIFFVILMVLTDIHVQ